MLQTSGIRAWFYGETSQSAGETQHLYTVSSGVTWPAVTAIFCVLLWVNRHLHSLFQLHRMIILYSVIMGNWQ